MKKRKLLIFSAVVALFVMIPWMSTNAQNKSLYLPGGNVATSYVQIPTTAGAGLNLNSATYTMEMWVKPNAANSRAYGGYIMARTGTGNPITGISQKNAAGATGVRLYRNSGNTSDSGDGIIVNSQWNHLAVVYNGVGTAVRLYVNGALAYTGGTAEAVYDFTGKNLYLGWDNAGTGRTFQGWMDEVRIWDKALTQQEIRTNMGKEMTGTEEGLLVYYNFNADTYANLGSVGAGANGIAGTVAGIAFATDNPFATPQLFVNSSVVGDVFNFGPASTYSFSTAGVGLTTQSITIETPTGITAIPSSLTAAQAMAGAEVRFIYDNSAAITAGTISVKLAGTAVKTFIVNATPSENMVYMWNLPGIATNAANSQITNFGWTQTTGTGDPGTASYGLAGSGSNVRAIDVTNLKLDGEAWTGRTVYMRTWQSPSQNVYNYEMYLKAGAYQFTGKATINSNANTGNCIYSVNSAKSNLGKSYGSTTIWIPETLGLISGSFDFVVPTDGVYYLTVATSGGNLTGDGILAPADLNIKSLGNTWVNVKHIYKNDISIAADKVYPATAGTLFTAPEADKENITYNSLEYAYNATLTGSDQVTPVVGANTITLKFSKATEKVTIKYQDGSGNTLKPDRITTPELVGEKYSAPASDLVSIIKDLIVYEYDPATVNEITIEDGVTLILKFKAAAPQPAILKVTATVGENGTVEIADKELDLITGTQVGFFSGESVTFTITPADGYWIDKVYFDGKDVTSKVNKGLFTTVIFSNTNLVVSFKEPVVITAPDADKPYYIKNYAGTYIGLGKEGNVDIPVVVSAEADKLVFQFVPVGTGSPQYYNITNVADGSVIARSIGGTAPDATGDARWDAYMAPAPVDVATVGAQFAVESGFYPGTVQFKRQADVNYLAPDAPTNVSGTARLFTNKGVSSATYLNGTWILEDVSYQAKLASLVGACNTLIPANYETAKWNAFNAVLIASTATLNDVASNEANYETAYNNLSAARNTLLSVDKAALLAKITEAQEIHDDAEEGTYDGQYAEGSKATLQTAIDAANVVYDAGDRPQVAVNAALATLTTALEAFEDGKVVIDFTAFDALVAQLDAYADAIQAEDGTPLKAALTTFEGAITAAQAIDKSNIIQTGVTEEITKLNTAAQTFIAVLKGQLGMMITMIDAYLAANEIPEAFAAKLAEVEGKLAAARTINESTDLTVVTQAAVNQAVSDLMTSAMGLYAMLTAELNGLIDEAQELHDAAQVGTAQGQYSQESKTTFQAAIDAAEAVIEIDMTNPVLPAVTAISQAVIDLQAAIDAFKASEIMNVNVDELAAKGILVYANKQQLHINGITAEVTITGYDFAGRTIFIDKTAEGQYTRALPSGSYVITLQGYVNGRCAVVVSK